MNPQLLIISTLWIEPDSSAAGRRMLQILRLFAAEAYRIAYATTAVDDEYAADLSPWAVSIHRIKVNDPSFDTLVQSLAPDVVVFDRYIAEEQFGWRVARLCPAAVRILDTEDLHCLRYARYRALKEKRAFHEDDLLDEQSVREIASIFRCDLALIISSVEMAMLQGIFQMSAERLAYLPFLEEEVDQAAWLPFDERRHFVSIGNFLHAPNADAVRYLRDEIWPLIRSAIPNAEVHVYGAYPSQADMQLDDPTKGFLVEGRAQVAAEVIGKARVLLSPLRFGAGLKGKFIDAMHAGTPVVGTRLGSEGMQFNSPWCGLLADDPEGFAEAAVKLYTDQEAWHRAQAAGVHIIREHFNAAGHSLLFNRRLHSLIAGLEGHRKRNFMGMMLMHHSMRSTEYMSRWIEEKNKGRD